MYACTGHCTLTHSHSPSPPSLSPVQVEGAPEHTTGEVTVSLVNASNPASYPACHLVGEVKKVVGQGANMTVK